MDFFKTLTGQGAICALAFMFVGCPKDKHEQGNKEDGHAMDTGRAFIEPLYRIDTLQGYADWSQCNGIACEQRAATVARICDEARPLDNRVWYLQADGSACSCPCVKQQALTGFQRDTLRYTDQVAEVKRVARRMRNRSRIEKVDLYHPRACGATHDCTEVSVARKWALQQGFLRPTSMLAKVPVVLPRNCLDDLVMRFHAVYPFFRVVSNDPATDVYPRNFFPHVDASDPLPTGVVYEINIPDNFLNDPHASCALLAFFIAHEIGHALAPGFACCSNCGEIVCESDCDYWGASVAMRAVFSGTEYIAMCQGAADQLIAYAGAVDPHSACGFPFCACECGNDVTKGACGWPPTACRAATILAAMRLDPKPDCTTTWLCDPARAGCPPAEHQDHTRCPSCPPPCP